jgi:2-amino-4-hydroxy-6-hydroxymethyldihydropteridine diphosphokinase
MTTVYLGLGTNLGDRLANLRTALEKLAAHVEVAKQSSVYRSVAQGVGEQPNFYNMVVEGETELGPHELLGHVKEVEAAIAPHTHNEARHIDIDILLYGDRVHETEELTIPHPRMHERAFVLAPLAEIAYLVEHPVLRKPIADLEDALGYYMDICQQLGEDL